MEPHGETPLQGALSGSALGLAVALGCGMLVGIERERRKRLGDDRGAAGLRSFMLAACGGALAQVLDTPGLVPIGALLIAALASLAYWRGPSPDRGLTTELALFATYLIGALSVQAPALGAACGAAMAALLVSRSRLHSFATELLSEQEMQDGVLLAAAALTLLPLVPSRPIEMLGGINPRPLAALAVLIMAMQAAGHLALRRLGPRGGALWAGLLSGFVSSTACIASMGSQARGAPQRAAMLAGVGAVSGAATFLQALVLSAALSPRAALALLPAALAGALGAGVCGLVLAGRASGLVEKQVPPSEQGSALRPRQAIMVVLMLAGVALLVSTAQSRLGNTAAGIGVALAGLADAHAPIASLAGLHAAGRLPVAQFVGGVLLAISVNSLTRCAVAAVAGGRGYMLRVGAALTAGAALAWLAAWWTVLR